MTNSTEFQGREAEIAALFETTFAASEGPAEGALIGKLADALMRTTPPADLHVCLTHRDATLAGAIVFSRLTYAADSRHVFVMGPVAVAPAFQRQGIGQGLVRFGLDVLRDAGVDVALTYGDPGYYTRLGFASVAETDVAAPYPLQYPQGWLGQSLSDAPLAGLQGPVRCVPAFADPAFW